jgi:8-oxo-dGTP pyrophosphatase MutT (NUDIX family)
VVPLDTEMNTYLVGQYRFALGQYSWEIPEGGGILGIDPLESAKRELLEETGIKASRWTELQRMHLSNSVSDELAIIYLAQDLQQFEPEPEDTEQLMIKKISFDEAYRMVCDGEITDSISVAAILKIRLREFIKPELRNQRNPKIIKNQRYITAHLLYQKRTD